MLCILSESSDKETLEVAKLLLNKEGIERNCVDHDMNSIMHLAVRSRKLEVVKYLVEEMKFPVDELNSDGKSAIAIAKDYGFNEIEQYLSKFNNSESQIQILEELMSYINESDKKKGKKGKKKKKNADIGMMTSEYSDNTVSVVGETKPEPTNIIAKSSEEEKKIIETIETKEEHIDVQPKVHKITAEEIEYYKNQERILKEKKDQELQRQEQLKQEKLRAEKESKKQKKKQQNQVTKVEESTPQIKDSHPIQQESIQAATEKLTPETIVPIVKVDENDQSKKISKPVQQNDEKKSTKIDQSIEYEELKNRLELFENLYREENTKRLQVERVLESKILEYSTIIANKPVSTEENINDLMTLANEELMRKAEQIKEVCLY